MGYGWRPLSQPLRVPKHWGSAGRLNLIGTLGYADGQLEYDPLEGSAGPYGPAKAKPLIVATTDPVTLPEPSTWFLATNLPAPGSKRAEKSELEPAELAEVVRLYGLRVWVEQSYKQVKGQLGWAEYQVRKDLAMRRHWQLVCCAFSGCWWALSRTEEGPDLDRRRQAAAPESVAATNSVEAEGEKSEGQQPRISWPEALRRLRAWREPYLMLRRYWQAWSAKPPPRGLKQLLDWLVKGRAIYLYVR